MSVIVKGMDMPKSCWECALLIGLVCGHTGELVPYKKKMKNCPLIELPEDILIGLSTEARKKGKWELRTDERFDIDYYKCSECGYEPYRKMDISNFCPNCGADMREGEEE